jgi:hypothetical protein
MYLANMRGIAATCSVRGTAGTGGTGDDDDERSGGTIPTSPRLRHTFSNVVQQTISSQLQTTCTPISLARRDYTTPVRLPVRNSSSMMRQNTDPIGTVESDGDDDLMSYLYTVGTAPCAAMPPLPKLTSEPSCVPSASWGEGSGDIKRVTINLNASNATLSPPASPLRRAAGGAGASYAADKENEVDEDEDVD